LRTNGGRDLVGDSSGIANHVAAVLTHGEVLFDGGPVPRCEDVVDVLGEALRIRMLAGTAERRASVL
jgi:hypothetical protein